MQYDNYFIVSDNEDHCIIVFDRDGNFVCKFGKLGHGKGKFNEPRCLSVNKAGHLMICDTLNHRVLGRVVRKPVNVNPRLNVN